MAAEIERKFLVKADAWRDGTAGVRMAQGYLTRDVDRTVRIRIAGEKAWITIKGRNEGITRQEFEYEIPLTDGRDLLDMCLPGVIDKTRHEVAHAGHVWEVDVFHGANDGLVVAEVELEDAEISPELPSWVGEEVSVDARYYNSSLGEKPFKSW
ncbi:MAG: CYTH domain-containing protein [Verrucomicrobiota bacterium]